MHSEDLIEAAIAKLEGLKKESTPGIEGSEADRELIATLHRTLDVQLRILRQGLNYVRAGLRFGPVEEFATELAKEILDTNGYSPVDIATVSQ